MTVMLKNPATGSPIYLKEHEECDDLFTPFTTVYLSNDKGKLRIRVCDRCGYEDVSCMHVHCDPDLRTLKLNCLLCGM